MDTKDRIRELFEGLAVERPQVNFEPGSRRRLVIEVVSPSFDEMEEGDRQMIVWSAILDELSADQQEAIDTVFTHSPAEHEALFSGSDLPPSQSMD